MRQNIPVYAFRKQRTGCATIALGVFFGGVLLIAFVVGGIFLLATYTDRRDAPNRDSRGPAGMTPSMSPEQIASTEFPPRGKYWHAESIEEKYDKFEKRTSLSLHLAFGREVSLFFTDNYNGTLRTERSNGVSLSATKSFRTVDFQILADGTKYSFSGNIPGTTYTGSITAPPEFIVLMANAQSVYVKVGSTDEVVLNEQHQRALRDFASRLIPQPNQKPTGYDGNRPYHEENPEPSPVK
jgi:hypothetical protein